MLGSYRAITNSSQSVTASTIYDGFGNTVSSTGSSATPFGFVGASQYQQDHDSGLMLLGHRYYDPSTGRFLSRDPAKAGTNWYAYCDNNPLSRIDAAGLSYWGIGVGIVVGIAVTILTENPALGWAAGTAAGTVAAHYWDHESWGQAGLSGAIGGGIGASGGLMLIAALADGPEIVPGEQTNNGNEGTGNTEQGGDTWVDHNGVYIPQAGDGPCVVAASET